VFEKTFKELHGKAWDDQKGMTIFALNEASAVLHKLNPKDLPDGRLMVEEPAQD